MTSDIDELLEYLAKRQARCHFAGRTMDHERNALVRYIAAVEELREELEELKLAERGFP